MKKRYIIEFLVLVVALILPFYGIEQDANMEDLKKAILPYIDKEVMQLQEESMVYRNYHLNRNQYEDCISYGPISFMDVDEITIFKLKEKDTGESILEAVENHIENQKISFEGYGIEQTKLLNDSYVEIKGSYVICIVKKDIDKIKDAISQCY